MRVDRGAESGAKNAPFKSIEDVRAAGRVEVVYQMNQRDAAVDFGLTVM
jgi:hypothetical protein